VNPYAGNCSGVKAASADPTAGTAYTGYGWYYNNSTGQIWGLDKEYKITTK